MDAPVLEEPAALGGRADRVPGADRRQAALAAVGATLQNIVKTTTYIVDAKYRQDMREVRAERLKHLEAPPANTALVVNRLIEPEFLVEIDVVAAVPLR